MRKRAPSANALVDMDLPPVVEGRAISRMDLAQYDDPFSSPNRDGNEAASDIDSVLSDQPDGSTVTITSMSGQALAKEIQRLRNQV